MGKFTIFAKFKIFAFQNNDFKIFAFQNPKFKVLGDVKISALLNPEFKILVVLIWGFWLTSRF